MLTANRHPSRCLGKRSTQGFTLIEVMITVIIVAFGLLGLLSLNGMSLASNHSAYLRSMASLYANDMSERLSANPLGIAAGDYDGLSGSGSDPGCITTGCTAAEMAQYDYWDWSQSLQTLPAGSGTITGTGSNSTFTIVVSWSQVTKSGPQTKSFTMEVIP